MVLEHVTTDKQLADVFTKPLPKKKFEMDRSLIRILPCLLLTWLWIVSLVGAYTFARTQPAFYESSDRPVFNGTKEFIVRIMVANPCAQYFRNITQNEDWNKALIIGCDSEFVKSTFKQMKSCKISNPFHEAALNKRSKRLIVGQFSR